jgi:arylsulfatase A-like enzyme
MSVGGRVGVSAILAWTMFLGFAVSGQASGAEARPNILLIMTDDQGYGDLGVHGNSKIRTPNLDRFARESVRLKSFFVSPVCSLTRASLMTGRYNYRTGVVDTYAGRSLMHPGETTIAEVLAAAGYRTGIFGKWHLGDNAPMRPIDRGFQEALVIKGGGIGQASDPPGGSSYTDPILQHNGRPEKYQGYCSDIYTTAAIDFLGASGDRPFFAYLSFNCPHDPLEAPPAELATYKSTKFAPDELPRPDPPNTPNSFSPAESVARVYAMVTNIDTNVGRILSALESHGLARDTIVIFLTDNGPAKARFNAGLRGVKGSVYDGGIHVPFYIRWPARFPSERVVDRIVAHIDVFPTLLAACGVAAPDGLRLDGRSLMPLLSGPADVPWPDRTLFFQWHRGDRPDPDRAFAARSQKYKLLRAEPPLESRKVPPLELFDMETDPGEQHNLATEQPQIAERLHAEYLAWFQDVSATRGFEPVRIEIGGDRESPTILTRQDWRGPRAGWGPNDQGHWEVEISRPGPYEVTLRLTPRRFPTVAHLSLRGVNRELDLKPGTTECTFHDVPWPTGPGRLEVWVEGNRATAGPLDVTIRRLTANP